MNEREAQIIRRQELLELEAQVQRATLAATFAQWEQKRALTYATDISSVALKLLRVPRIRWLVLASVLSKIRPGKKG